MPDELLDRVDVYRDKLAADTGLTVSRSDALRLLIAKALDLVAPALVTAPVVAATALPGAVAPPTPVAAAEDPAPADEEQLGIIFDLSAAEVPKKRANRHDELMPEVLRLHGEGKSQGEIARALDVNQSQISRWLSKARKDGLID
ncbi:helix-turn-helix domain-containing protein [Azotobacter salinestris]|uniref:helix-turn-helix domain-containing protein n=1 Tax=Azotobacter salinestris TaxID=69964 RepID=UPI0032DF226A